MSNLIVELRAIQNLNLRFLVLYNASAKDANATVVDRKNIDIEFIVDTKGYWFGTDNESEGYYLTAILNSTAPNNMMKDFQSRGLFGARDVHKKILDVYYPKYSDKNIMHKRLAQLSQQAHEKVKKYLIAYPPQQTLSPIFLGRLRMEIKKHVKLEMDAIDDLVQDLLS